MSQMANTYCTPDKSMLAPALVIGGKKRRQNIDCVNNPMTDKVSQFVTLKADTSATFSSR